MNFLSRVCITSVPKGPQICRGVMLNTTDSCICCSFKHLILAFFSVDVASSTWAKFAVLRWNKSASYLQLSLTGIFPGDTSLEVALHQDYLRFFLKPCLQGQILRQTLQTSGLSTINFKTKFQIVISHMIVQQIFPFFPLSLWAKYKFLPQRC